MSASGVFLVPNVLCVRKDGQRLTEAQIASRLSYFQLLELCRRNPDRFPSSLHYETPTPRQRLQMQAFLRERTSSLWQVRHEFRPMAGVVGANPFISAATGTATIPEVTVEESRPSGAPAGLVEAGESSPGPAPLVAEAGPDDEQTVVVRAPSSRNMLVVAPPGTGKTHVLVDRIAFLVSEGFAQNPAQEILVLSFTRSAVAEVRRRLRDRRDAGAHPNVAYATVSTFDSLASRCLAMDLDPEQFRSMDYTQRIRLFTKRIETGLPNALDAMKAVHFLFVDEVQDLVGDRAEMVLAVAAIVSEHGGAVCFLGDPAQAIYDYDSENSEGMTSADFLRSLVAGSYGSSAPERVEFETYRRFETPEMETLVKEARHAMGDDGLQPDGSRMEELISGLGDPVDLADLAAVTSGSQSCAILTRHNLEAFQIWSACRRAGIEADLWRGAGGNYWPGWIARLCLGFKLDSMSVDLARRRWADCIGPVVSTSFEQALALLQHEGVLDDGRIDLVALNRAVASGSPSAGGPLQRAGVTISTIHRSKGLEFDNVLLYQPANEFVGNANEVRIVYVAATRAKRRLSMLREEHSFKRGAKNGKRPRLKTHHFHLNAYPRYPSFGLLLDGADEADWKLLPATFASQELQELSEFLWAIGGAGVPRDASIEQVEGSGRRMIVAGGRVIGTPSPGVVADIDAICRLQGRSFLALAGLQIVDVATHAYDLENDGARSAFGAACLGLAPVISGIGEVSTR